MKDLIGRKVKGFKFKTDLDRIWYEPDMDKNIGEVGVIKRYDKSFNDFLVAFENGLWFYPAEEIEQHLVDEPKVDNEVLGRGSKKPFTKEEEQIMSLLVEVHNKFLDIEQTHSNDIKEWVDGIHKCQSVLKGRVIIRDYPDVFLSK